MVVFQPRMESRYNRSRMSIESGSRRTKASWSNVSGPIRATSQAGIHLSAVLVSCLDLMSLLISSTTMDLKCWFEVMKLNQKDLNIKLVARCSQFSVRPTTVIKWATKAHMFASRVLIWNPKSHHLTRLITHLFHRCATQTNGVDSSDDSLTKHKNHVTYIYISVVPLCN